MFPLVIRQIYISDVTIDIELQGTQVELIVHYWSGMFMV